MKKTTALCTICSLIATAALAQEPSAQPGQPGQPGRPGSQRQSQYGTSSSRYGQSSMSQQGLRVSQQVMNATVKSQDGQQLGQIEDLIANPQTGRLEFAVISKGDKLCPIPFQLLSPEGAGSSSTSSSATTGAGTSTDPSTTPGSSATASSRAGQKTTFVARVDSAKLQQAPSFSRTQWPEISPSWSQQIYSHFGVQPEAVGSPGSSSDSLKSGSQGSSSPGSSSTSGSSSDKSSTSDKSTDKDKPKSDN